MDYRFLWNFWLIRHWKKLLTWSIEAKEFNVIWIIDSHWLRSEAFGMKLNQFLPWQVCQLLFWMWRFSTLWCHRRCNKVNTDGCSLKCLGFYKLMYLTFFRYVQLPMTSSSNIPHSLVTVGLMRNLSSAVCWHLLTWNHLWDWRIFSNETMSFFLELLLVLAKTYPAFF